MKNQKIGKLIKKLRKEKNLTQQQLGDHLGVSSKTISKWECETSIPDILILKEISKIFDITIEEILEGKKIHNKKKMNPIIILIIIIIILGLISLLIFSPKDKKEKAKENKCTVIRTYYIDNIANSNDENYLYITLHEFQKEGTFTIKLPKSISKNLEVKNNYEITFKTNKDYVLSKSDELFEMGEIIELKHTDKVGLEQLSTYYWDK